MRIKKKIRAGKCIIDLLSEYESNDFKFLKEDNYHDKVLWLQEHLEDVEIEIDKLFLKFIPKIMKYANRADSVYVITSKDGKTEIAYVVNHFAKVNFYWASEGAKREFKYYDFKYAIEMLDTRYEQALLMSIFEGILNYFSSTRSEKVLKLDLLYITTKRISFDERKFGKYLSLSNSIIMNIKNQIKMYNLLNPLAIELISDDMKKFIEESKKDDI